MTHLAVSKTYKLFIGGALPPFGIRPYLPGT